MLKRCFASVELTLKISKKKRKKSSDELSMFIATIANFIDKYRYFGLFSAMKQR